MGRSLSRLRIGAAAAVTAAAIGAGNVAHGQMAVFDASALQQSIQQVANTAKMLEQAKQQYDELQRLSSATGLKDAALEGTGLSGPLRTIEAALQPPRVSFDSWRLPKELLNPNLGSVGSARSFVDQALRVVPNKNGILGFEDRDAVVVRRMLASKEAASNGYALALSMRGAVQPAFERFASLADEGTRADDLMKQIRVTNKLLAAIAGELVAQKSILAALLENQTGQAIATTPVLVTGTAASSQFSVPAPSGQLGE